MKPLFRYDVGPGCVCLHPELPIQRALLPRALVLDTIYQARGGDSPEYLAALAEYEAVVTKKRGDGA